MKKTWLLGFGFFSISLTWGLYNAFIPLFLDNYVVKSAMLVGFLMTIDNYFGLFLQPIIGRKSDKTDTKIGKRMPFLLIGMPLAAIFCALIPMSTSFSLLILFMVLMNLSMSLYRSPTVSLMPDITESSKRTQANGIINLMGGIGSIFAFTVGSKLYDQHIALPFLTSSILTLVSLVILMVFIRERRDALEYIPHTPQKQETVTHERVWGRAHILLRQAKKEMSTYKQEWTLPTIFLLGAIYFWFFSYQGIEALFTLYGRKELNLTDTEASFSLAFFSLSFVAAAIPAGYLGHKYGKKGTIMFGVVGLIIVFSSISFVDSLLALRILLLIGGIFWAMININSYPFVIALGKESSIGTRTGIYYIASSLAALSSPPLMGLIVDLLGYSYLFYAASCGMIIALFFLFGVKDQGHTKRTTFNASM